jgi:hypothetical protein
MKTTWGFNKEILFHYSRKDQHKSELEVPSSWFASELWTGVDKKYSWWYMGSYGNSCVYRIAPYNNVLGYPHSFTSKRIFSAIYSFYRTVFCTRSPLYPISISNYSLFYIILYNYHILFLLFNNNIVNINCKSQFLKNR